MKTIHIKGHTGDSNIFIGEKLQNVNKYATADNRVIITDDHVWELYGSRFPSHNVITIGTGEQIKNLTTVEMIYQQLIDFGADRATLIIGIGGGIVCDITGFVASTYMRGLRFGYVATTLLSQVDASVGGKTGVNLEGYKNMVGVFKQPEFVVCDLSLLNTLPPREVSCGLAEIVKHAAIADATLFSYLENNHAKAISLEAGTIEYLVYQSVRIKAAIVCQDETEKGDRRKLNFGHTFGHALEKTCGLSHGEAVSIGMVIASELSASKGYLGQTDNQRLKRLLENMDLPTRIKMDSDLVWDALQRDKKRYSEKLHFVVLNKIGNARVETVSLQDLKDGSKELI